MFNLLIILLSAINSESKGSNNYRIAKYLIENINNLENLTLTELAKNCFVSNSSISRFCKDIGLNDFNTLKNQLAIYPIEHHNAKTKYDYHGYNPNSVCLSYIQSVINNLNVLYNEAFEQNIFNLVNDIYNYKEVASFGYLHSQNIALNLQYDLQTSGKIIYTCLKYTEQAEYIKNANKDTLIIIFSESGTYFDRVFNRTKPFKNLKNRPKIYLVTASKDIHYPYIDNYIRCITHNDYSSRPYPFMIVADLLCIQYAKLIKEKNPE